MSEPDQQAIADANRIYFRVLGSTRASLSNLGTMAFVTLFPLGLDTFVGLNALIFWEGADGYLGLFMAHVVVLGLCAVLVLLGSFKALLYRFQVFFSGAFAVVAALLVYSICMLGVVLSSFDGARGQGLSPVLFGVAGVVAMVLLAGSAAVHVWLLRRRLRLGHSEKRTLGNFGAVSASSRSRTFWITFGVVAIVPNVVTQGHYLTNTVGVLGLLLFIAVTPSLPAEWTYLAYLKSQDRGYWEKRPRAKRRQRRAGRDRHGGCPHRL